MHFDKPVLRNIIFKRKQGQFDIENSQMDSLLIDILGKIQKVLAAGDF